jgi:predicted acetyltransferase
VSEAAGDDLHVVESLLHFLAREAKARYTAEIPLDLPPDHPFARRALSLCGGEATVKINRNGGWMGRFVNLKGTFEKMASEFEERLRFSAFKDWRGTLRLATNLGTIELQIVEGNVAVREETGSEAIVCTLPQTALIQLLFGYRDAAEVALEPDVDVPSEALPLLHTLFPIGYPFISRPDYF